MIEIQLGLIFQTFHVAVEERDVHVEDRSRSGVAEANGLGQDILAGPGVAGPSIHKLRGVLLPQELLEPALTVPVARSKANTPLTVALVGPGVLADESPISTDLDRESRYDRGDYHRCDYQSRARRQHVSCQRDAHGSKPIQQPLLALADLMWLLFYACADVLQNLSCRCT